MDYTALFQLQLMMFTLMGVGFVLRKRNVLSSESKTLLSDLVLNIVLPCNILSSFCIEFDFTILKNCAQVLIVSIVLQLFCTLLASVLYNRLPQGQKAVLQYATVTSNAAFLGNAVVEGIYGSLGMLYTSFYLIPMRIGMWTAGVSYFTTGPNKREVLKKILCHPCIIATEAGIVVMLTQLPLPVFLSKSISSIGGCTTPMTMMMIGMVLADAGFAHMVNRVTVAYSFVRLVFIPAAVLLGCRVAGVEAMAAGVSVLLAGMPAGAITTVLATKYHGDEAFASQCVVFSTLLSMGMLPLWCAVLNFVF